MDVRHYTKPCLGLSFLALLLGCNAHPLRDTSFSEAATAPSHQGEQPAAIPSLTRTGSGFFINRQGAFLTSAHVIEGCNSVRLPELYHGDASVMAVDAETDLALLKLETTPDAVAAFRGGSVLLGEDVMVAGFPLPQYLASSISVTTGIISTMAGPFDDERIVQITAPVQIGHSGGPVLDMSGNVIALVTGKLDPMRIADATGDFPQNVSFGVQVASLRNFLSDHGVEYRAVSPERPLSNHARAAKAAKFTFQVQCWQAKG